MQVSAVVRAVFAVQLRQYPETDESLRMKDDTIAEPQEKAHRRVNDLGWQRDTVLLSVVQVGGLQSRLCICKVIEMVMACVAL